MEENKRIEVKCYAGFLPAKEGEKRYKVITDANGSETGIEISGMLTKFGYCNENGLIFENESYDKYIAEYFEKNSLNIPIDVMHCRDVRNLAGIATVLTKTSEGVIITAFIPKGVYYYGLIKTLIDNGILQGFSNYGWIEKFNVTPDGALQIFEFKLVSASLVDIPADIHTGFVSNSTRFEGFDHADHTRGNSEELPVYLY